MPQNDSLMMEDTFLNSLSLIQQRYSSMSPVEKRIADCILADPEQTTKSTVVFIAKKANVSQGSISNFAMSLGFSGFSQLKINLAQNLPSLDTDTPLKGTSPNPNDVMRKLIESAKTSFESTSDTISYKSLKTGAELLLNANRIVLTGFAHSAPVAQDLAFRMMSIGLPAQAISDAVIANVACAQLTDKGVLLVISHSGRTKDALTCAKIAKRVNAKVICFTSYALNPLEQLSDVTFVAVSNESQNYRESMTARLTQLMIGDCLLDYIAREIGDEAVERMDSTVEIFESNRENLL